MIRLSVALTGALALALFSTPSTRKDEPQQQGTTFRIHPIGRVKKTDDRTMIVLDIKPFIPGYDSTPDASVPDWLNKARKRQQAKQ